MTSIADLKTVAKVAIGSAEYAVTSFAERVEAMSPEQGLAATRKMTTWTMRCVDDGTLKSSRESAIDDLVSVGQAVTYTEQGGSRTLSTRPGYPKVSLASQPRETVEGWLEFDLTVVAEVLAEADDDGLIEHDYTAETAVDWKGNTTITQTGSVTIEDGITTAAQWIETFIVQPARDLPANLGRRFDTRVRVGLDPLRASYTLTVSDPNASIGAGILNAQVRDVSSRSARGEISRVVSGSAEGSNAATYASSQKITPAANLILTDERVSNPSVPDGRVEFEYRYVQGVSDAISPDVFIFSFSETIRTREGIPELGATQFWNSPPTLLYGRQPPSIYEVVTIVEFTGDWNDLTLATPTGLNDANLVQVPERELSAAANGLRTLRLRQVYMYDSSLTNVPVPREIGALS